MSEFGVPDIVSNDQQSSLPNKQEEIQSQLPDRAKLTELTDHIDLQYWLTIEELLQRESCEKPEDLRNSISAKVDIMTKSLITDYEMYTFLYQCYNALHSTTTLPDQLISLKDDFSSFEHFQKAFLADVTDAHILNRIQKGISATYTMSLPFDQLVIRKGRFPDKPSIIRSKQQAEEEVWIPYGYTERNHYDPTEVGYVYTTQGVLDEILTIQKDSSYYHNYFHSTTSASLPGIAKHGGLLSRDELERRGDKALSGERSDVDPRVYVEQGKVNYGVQYSNISWFNEFPIDIEINENIPRERLAPDQGISLGKQVPIDSIVRIYSPHRDKAEAEQWIKQNAPHAVYQSYDAHFVMQNPTANPANYTTMRLF